MSYLKIEIWFRMSEPADLSLLKAIAVAFGIWRTIALIGSILEMFKT
jgi:hypothetical protein